MSQTIDLARILSGATSSLVISTEGEEKSGKTTFELTAEGPLGILDFDLGIRRAISGRPDLKAKLELPGTMYESFSIKLPGSLNRKKTDEVIGHFSPVLRKFEDTFDAMVASDCRTIIIDSATEAWKLVEYVIAGRAEKFPYHLRPEMYAVFRGMIDKAKIADKNLILSHRVKTEWENDKPTGRMKRDGFPAAQYDCDAFIRLRGETVEPTSEKPARVRFYLDFIKSGYKATMLNGTSWEGCDWDMMKGLMLE